MNMIVADATPIIAFARGGRLELLGKVTKKLVIPKAVRQEVVVKGRNKPGAKQVKAASWIKTKQIEDRGKLKSLPSGLGQGEKESIVLAKEQEAILITDDYQARREATKRNLEVTTSLNVIQQAKSQGLIAKIKAPLDDLIAAGFYITPEIYKEVIEKAEESEQDEYEG